MLTVQNDWIEYDTRVSVRTEAVPARRVVVRGGAACAQRLPVVAAGVAAPAARPRTVQPARPVAHRAASARLRLTRRGRVVLIVLPSLLVLSGALLAAAPGVAEAAQPSAPVVSAPTAAVATVVVGSGDSLWSIAERIAPTSDPRDVVAAIEDANHLTTDDLQAGDVLVLPALP